MYKKFLSIILLFIFMATTTWGMLQKSLTDSETIEEAIERIVQEHDDDANSHLDDGQSLKSHKASEIIDHLALSIVQDKIGDGEISLQKLLADHRILITAMESLDGWSLFGNNAQDFGCLRLYTNATTNAYAGGYVVPSYWVGIDWDKDFFWQATIKTLAVTNQEMYFGIGGTDYIGGYSSAGFYVDDGDLYCYHAVDSGGGYAYTTFQITGITLTDWHTYRIIYDESEGELSFYIDGILKKTFDSDLPTSNTDEALMFQVKTLEDVVKSIIVSDILFSVPK
jgi:hypothetical protein